MEGGSAAPIDADAAIEIGSRARVGIAKCIEPSCRVIRRVLVVEAMDRDDCAGLDLQQQGMLCSAFDTP